MLHGYRQLFSLYKNKDIYSDTAKDVETRFDTSNYELDRQAITEKKKQKINCTNEKCIRWKNHLKD